MASCHYSAILTYHHSASLSSERISCLDLIHPNVQCALPTTTITTAATTTTTLPLPPQLQQSSSESLLIKRMGELEQHIADRVEENQALESRLDKQGSRIRKLETMDWSNMIRKETSKFIESHEIDRKIKNEILLQRMLEENYDKGHAEHRMAYEALQGSIHRDEDEVFDDDKAQKETKKKGKQESPKPPPGSPLTTTFLLHHRQPSGAFWHNRAYDTPKILLHTGPVSSTRQEDHQPETNAGGNLSLKTTNKTRPRPNCVVQRQQASSLVRVNQCQVPYNRNSSSTKTLEYLRYGRKAGQDHLSISKMKRHINLDLDWNDCVPDHSGIRDCKSIRLKMNPTMTLDGFLTIRRIQEKTHRLDTSFPEESIHTQMLTIKAPISTETSDGLAAIQAQLNNLRSKIKKVNEKVYAAQVGCELCKGPHYTKDCPLKEEGKTLEEAYYAQFGAPYQPRRQYRAASVGFYQRNNRNSSYPDRRQTLEESLTKVMAESAKRHEENSNIIKEIRASTDAAIRNQGASIKTLEI
ncbi:formin-like protein 1 [Tanacetum coccineum]|uniref:Formin-like protein 1 n=1 Tax=Tanacetum coccineum TaxID=301880 RepID=A0ABQ5GFG0_9ASTR